MALNFKRVCIVLSCYLLIFLVVNNVQSESKTSTEVPDLSVELVDGKWDQIQKGQWLIGFFDKETKESLQLEEDWQVFALKCKEQNINAGKVFAPQSPGLYVRFLVTVFPKVFYIKNGVAHEVKQPSRQTLIDLIKDQKWSTLKPVNFLSNPFSVQMSLLSHLFVHAVNLYNFEDAIVQKFIPYSSATDVAFAATFVIVGTILGLILTCVIGLISIILTDTKDSEEEESTKADKDSKASEEDSEGDSASKVNEEESVPSTDDDGSVRKRK